MSRTRMLIITASITVALTGCVAPVPAYPPPSQPVVSGPLNSEPWVSTQAPAGTYASYGSHLPFQTPNSLPAGAWNQPAY